MDETQYTPEQLAQLQSDNDEFDFVMNDDAYEGYNPYVGSTNDADAYNAATNNEGAAETPTQTTPMATTPTTATPEKDAYEKALAERNNVNAENLRSFRDLLNYYKPETPEEKEKRERMERTRQNIVGFSNMAAALGNLATAASSKDGRAVKVEPSSDDLDKAIQRERGLREARDAKGIQLRNQYMSLRKQMADENLKTTWQAYMQRQADDNAKAKLANEAAKAQSDAEYKKARLLFDISKANDTKEYRDALLKVRQAAVSAKNAQNKSSWINLPIKNGEQSLFINPRSLNNEIARGALEQILPESYFSDEDKETMATARKDQNGNLYVDTMLRYVGKYLQDGGIKLPEDATEEDKNKEAIRWNRMMELLQYGLAGELQTPNRSKVNIEGFGGNETKKSSIFG